MSGPGGFVRALAATALSVALVAGLPRVAAAETPEHYSPTAVPAGVDPATADEWTDPATVFGYDEDELADVPFFAFRELHDSTVFASGIDWIPIDDDPLPDAEARHLRTLQVAATIEREVEDTSVLIRLLRPRVHDLNDRIDHELDEEARLAAEIVQLEEAIAEFAVRAFIGDDDSGSVLTTDDGLLSENRVLSGQVREAQFDGIANRTAERERRARERAAMEDERVALRVRIVELRERRLALLADLADVERLAARTAAGYQTVLHQRLTGMVEDTDVPLIALNAYVIAARSVAVDDDACGLEWWMLAGIGRIESQHGHFGDSELDVDGSTTDAIRGPALDGRVLEGAEFVTAGSPLPPTSDRTETSTVAAPPPPPPADGTASPDAAADGAPGEEPVEVKRLALIEDTDDGRLDGDRVYDRAVGPMQFIPQTWRQWGVDATGDDDPDPQNVYDAALSSARYLCAATNTMTTEEGRQRAFFAYNHDDAYTEAVEASAQRYRRQIVLPELRPGSAPELGVATPIDDIERDVARTLEGIDLSSLDPWWATGGSSPSGV